MEAQEGSFFNARSMAYWTIRAIVQAYGTFYMIDALLGSALTSTGRPFDQTMLSYFTYICAVSLQCITVVLESHSLTWINFASLCVTYMGFIAFLCVSALSTTLTAYHVSLVLLGEPIVWFCFPLVVLVNIFPFYFERFLRFNYYPFEYQKLAKTNKSIFNVRSRDRLLESPETLAKYARNRTNVVNV